MHPMWMKKQCATVLITQMHVVMFLAWLGLETTGFGLALGGFGFWDPQAKP